MLSIARQAVKPLKVTPLNGSRFTRAAGFQRMTHYSATYNSETTADTTAAPAVSGATAGWAAPHSLAHQMLNHTLSELPHSLTLYDLTKP